MVTRYVVFLITSILYCAAIAATDGLFNRLIFRDSRMKKYDSSQKAKIYLREEWVYISLIFLILLGLVLPSIFSYLIGGSRYVISYWIIFLIVQWDLIFGKLVFDDWVGDTPSMKLPIVGWIRLELKVVIVARFFLAAILGYLLLSGYN